jgi:hypothetical protein
MPVIKAGEAASGVSEGGAVGWTPLAARSEIRLFTESGDINGGNCNTTVAGAGSAAHPAAVTQSRSNNAKARDRAAIAGYLG